MQNRSTRCKLDRATNSNRKQLWLTRNNRKKLNQPRKASKAAVAMEGERGGEELTAMAAFPASAMRREEGSDSVGVALSSVAPTAAGLQGEGGDGWIYAAVVRSFRRLATAAAWLLALLIDPQGRPAGRTITPRK